MPGAEGAVVLAQSLFDGGQAEIVLLALEVAHGALGAPRVAGPLVGDVPDHELIDDPVRDPAPPLDSHVAEGGTYVLPLLHTYRQLLSPALEVIFDLLEEGGEELTRRFRHFSRSKGSRRMSRP